MLHGQKIIYVSIVDNKSKCVSELGIRIWHHEVLVRDILNRKNAIIGRKTYDLTGWKGPKTWILTKKKNLKVSNVGLIHDIDDLHLHTEGDIFVLGGISLFKTFEPYIDEIHLYVLNDKIGKEGWIKMDMKQWYPKNYKNENVWSYAHLFKIEDLFE
jgi:dihydrofolate reductase